MAVESDANILAFLRDYWGVAAAMATGFAGVVMGRERTRHQVETVADRIGAFEVRLGAVEKQGHDHAAQLASVHTELGLLPEMRQDIKDILIALGGRKGG